MKQNLNKYINFLRLNHVNTVVALSTILNPGPSPIIFPNAQTACSQTLWCFEFNSVKNNETAPADTTACVCWDVPLKLFTIVGDYHDSGRLGKM